ncbi:hypothetical protein ACFL1A_01975 [Patescibacteria group bacterium]
MKRKRVRKPSIYKSKSIYKLSGITVLIYLSYLIILPLILNKIVPCLANHPFDSYNDSQCSVGLALNWYLLLALSGFGIITLGYWYILKNFLFKKKKTITNKFPIKSTYYFLIPSAVMMAVSLVIAFHLFIPSAEAAVRIAPIILESIK